MTRPAATQPFENAASLSTECCIAGGGPAGMMAGLLLARAGVDVVVLEKHADFLRDFRGDTIHPSTLAILDELGLLDRFLRLPHAEVRELGARFGDVTFPIADFGHVPGRCKFIAFMPQCDFLDFVADVARGYSNFHLRLQTEATGLLDGARGTGGVLARTPQGPLRIAASLVIAADGRHSLLREQAAPPVRTSGAPIDVVWFSLSRRAGDPAQAIGNVAAGAFLVTIDRGDYYQCGLVISKYGFGALRARGIGALRARIAAVAPFLADRVHELRTWDDAKLLTVTVDRLHRWHRPGFICIGDAAHAMSPVGGVGINLAIQDAVATANLLAAPLREGRLKRRHLRALQRRRELPVRVTQTLQVFAQSFISRRLLNSTKPVEPPFVLRVLRAYPVLRRLPAYAIGFGLRPEHVRTRA